MRVQEIFGAGCAQHESTQPHKTRSGQQSANPAFEGGYGGPESPGLSGEIQASARMRGGRGV